jgi:RNase P subunit RPR2
VDRRNRSEAGIVRLRQAVGKIHCRKCRRALADSPDGHVLRVGDVEMFTRVVMACAKCGHIQIWCEATIPDEPDADLTANQYAVSHEVRRRLGKG